MDRQKRIEIVRKPDAICLGHKSQKAAVRIESPEPSSRIEFQTSFIITIKSRFANAATVGAINDIDGLLSYPVNADHFNRSAWKYPFKYRAGFYVFQ